MDINLNDIEHLRETEKTDVLKLFFYKLLSNYRNTNNLVEKEEAAEILRELSDKQWHNYEWFDLEKVDKALQNDLDKYVYNFLEGELSAKLVDLLTQSIAALGLTTSYEKLKAISHQNLLVEEVTQAICENLKEFGESVKDPYRYFR